MVTINLEKIGGAKPWIARITGTDSKYGLAREFVTAQVDYSGSNRPGTRGVIYSFDLSDGYYELKGGSSWGSANQRKFLHVVGTEAKPATLGEVKSWLSAQESAQREAIAADDFDLANNRSL